MHQGYSSVGAVVGIVLSMLLVILLPTFSEARLPPETLTFNTEAEVIVVEDRVLEGEMIGGVLSSPSGEIGEVNKVGVSFEVCGMEFLKDLEVNYASLSRFRDRGTLPLRVVMRRTVNSSWYGECTIFLKNTEVCQFELGESQGDKVMEWYEENERNES